MKAKIKNTFGIAIILLAFSFLVIRCDSGDEFESTGKNEVTFYLGGELSQGQHNVLVVDENNPNNKYSRIDSIGIYGFGFDYLLPDSLKDCDLKIVVNAKIRESQSINSSIAFSLHGTADSIYYWGELYSGNYIKQLNNWTTIKDSVIIENKANNSRSRNIKVFSRKINGKGFFDVDDLVIKFSRQ